MLTFTVECDVPADRTITLTLPDDLSSLTQLDMSNNQVTKMSLPE